MRVSPTLAALVGTVALATAAEYQIELSPGDIRTVTEEEKWALKAEHTNFIDVTHLKKEPTARLQVQAKFPDNITHTDAVNALIPKLSKANQESVLTEFVKFHNRYYNSTNGLESSEWLLGQVQDIVSASNATNVEVRSVKHDFQQPSIIASIPGKSEKTIVLGAHQDSINLKDNANGLAPGADDDGTGTVTILEALRVLLTDPDVASNQAANTIEFHWYAGEEAGLLGSGQIFQQYADEGRDVKAMLQQDMTGYVAPNVEEVIGIITDNVDGPLTEFLKKVAAAYSSIPTADTKCGYGCSDHASASRVGYPAVFAFESKFEDRSPFIHSEDDTIDTVDFNHVLEFTKLALGFAYELGFASL